MNSAEVERVLANWIAQAVGPPGQLAPGIDLAQWVARQFLAWWREQTVQELDDAEAAVAAVRQELERMGGWSNPELGEALHELTHARDALAGLRGLLGFEESEG